MAAPASTSSTTPMKATRSTSRRSCGRPSRRRRRPASAYSYNDAKNNLKSTEIASVLWQNQPVQGDPNRPELSYSEFGQRHRIVGTRFVHEDWSRNVRTQVGMFVEVAEGNRFAGLGGNRYSFIYSGDVNGDGAGWQRSDLHPARARARSSSSHSAAARNAAAAMGRAQRVHRAGSPTCSEHRGEIAERFGAVNPWYHNVDLRILQDLGFGAGDQHHGFQLSLDVLNFTT